MMMVTMGTEYSDALVIFMWEITMIFLMYFDFDTVKTHMSG
jgi:hypothetical protein